MFSKLFTSTIYTAAIALAATQESAYQSPANPVPKEKQQAEKKICRWLPVTGSHINQKFCLTKEEWKKVEALNW